MGSNTVQEFDISSHLRLVVPSSPSFLKALTCWQLDSLPHVNHWPQMPWRTPEHLGVSSPSVTLGTPQPSLSLSFITVNEECSVHDGSPSHPQGTVLSGMPSGVQGHSACLFTSSFTVSVGYLLLKESDGLIVNHGAACSLCLCSVYFFLTNNPFKKLS